MFWSQHKSIQEISLKKYIDIFGMSKVRILIKKLKRKNGGCLYLCYVFGQLSSVKCLA